MSVHCKLLQVQNQEYENGLLMEMELSNDQRSINVHLLPTSPIPLTSVFRIICRAYSTRIHGREVHPDQYWHLKRGRLTYLTNFSLRSSLSTLNSLAGTVNTKLFKIVAERKWIQCFKWNINDFTSTYFLFIFLWSFRCCQFYSVL